jgi:hypothetical protein
VTKHSILDEIPKVLREKAQRALRNIARLTDEHRDQELDAAMAPDEETLAELRRICTRKGTNADAVITLLSQDHQGIDN